MADKIQSCFERYEKKYMLTPDQQRFLLDGMRPYMQADDYGEYTICNVYYDTDDWQLVRASIEKPVYKEKLRVRSYGVPAADGSVFVELKKKYDGGAGVAVAGAFGLVRFRSAPGTAREIGVLFLAMAIGLATGMGFVGLAVLAFVIISAVLLLLTAVRFGQPAPAERALKITIPENLDYEGLFDDLFAKYTRTHTLVRVKTSNMGTMYELEYRIILPQDSIPKEFIDALRCRNGNLNIVCGREQTHDAL